MPVIATSIGGFAETVEDRVSGFLVPNGDIAELAMRMAEIADGREFPDQRIDDDVIARISARHDVRTHTDRMREIFQRTIAAHDAC